MLKQMGMEVEMDLDGTITGDALYEKATGTLKTHKTLIEMKGNMGVMGQTIPMLMAVNTTVAVKKL
jgi:hypothetical protein